jgi:hypothetical protein
MLRPKNYCEELKNELFKFRNLGEEVAQNGTLLIGRAPHVAPQAWLHSIYPVLNEQDIRDLEDEVKADIPLSYKEFLMNCSNGLGLFVGKFSLYGLRKQLGRSIEASRQPFSPVIANVDERPTNAKESYFIIGGYKWDGSKLYIDKDTNQVHFCDRRDTTSLYSWDSFETMVVSEVRRICTLFDEKGVVIDAKRYTTPIPRKMA